MKRKALAAALAAVPLVLVATIAISITQVEPPERSSQSMIVSGDDPKNTFGFAEATGSSWANMPEPSPPARMTRLSMPSPPANVPPPRPARSSSDLSIPAADLAVSLPKIAYRYSYGFRLDPRNLADVQRGHADLCERQGPAVCRIIAMEQSGAADDEARGSLVLAVAAPRARSFGSELARLVASTGGSQAASSISGEDLSKQIVDTEARLRARTLLRDRLMDVLATRRGTVTELVEAERGVAQVNEEIDQARSWLSEMKGRVDYSALHIAYNSIGMTIREEQRGGFIAPIRSVIGALGGIFGATIAAILALLAILGPIAAVVWAGRRLWQRWQPAGTSEALA